MSLETDFHEAMLDICRKAAKCGYHPGRFRQMVAEQGGLRTAQSLLNGSDVSEGFTKLWELGRLDISMEALVIKEPWSALFTAPELDAARKRLCDVGYRL